MPRKAEHDAMELKMLGVVTGMTDLMDAPVKDLQSHHRVVNHDMTSILALALQLGGDYSKNLAAGMLHIQMDSQDTADKKQLSQYEKSNGKPSYRHTKKKEK